MYSFLGAKKQKIEAKDFLNISILCSNDNNDFSIVRIYVLANDDNSRLISSFEQFDDVTAYIGFKVRRDGKVCLTLK